MTGEIMVQVPVFGGLEPHQWARILPVFKFIEFQPGEIVYNIGDAGREMYIVIRGELCLKNENDEQTCTIHPGDYVGAMSALDIEGYRYEVRSR